MFLLYRLCLSKRYIAKNAMWYVHKNVRIHSHEHTLPYSYISPQKINAKNVFLHNDVSASSLMVAAKAWLNSCHTLGAQLKQSYGCGYFYSLKITPLTKQQQEERPWGFFPCSANTASTAQPYDTICIHSISLWAGLLHLLAWYACIYYIFDCCARPSCLRQCCYCCWCCCCWAGIAFK